ncbi:MAG: hypothetical protein R2702_12090 [Acidimicrobiales bacterium]
MSPAAGKLDPDALAALEEQRDFLLRSIADLDRELAAGDLDPDDHRTLRDDYTARAAQVLRAIDAQRAGLAEAVRPRSLGRTLAIVAGIAVFALLSGLAVASALGARKAGESASGGVQVQQTPSQRANECIPKMQSDPQGALDCFSAVREDDPNNPVAMTRTAWLLSNASQQVDDWRAGPARGPGRRAPRQRGRGRPPLLAGPGVPGDRRLPQRSLRGRQGLPGGLPREQPSPRPSRSSSSRGSRRRSMPPGRGRRLDHHLDPGG